MASRIDDKLFVALLRGDHEALAAGWTTAFKCALRFAVSLFGGKYVCFAGKSAEDVASDATLKFVQAVASGQVTEGNVYGYLSRTVHTTFIDLIRKASREAHADDRWADGEISSLDHAADPSLTQEQAMLAREEEEARERAQHAMLHDALLLWCEWPGTMMCWCEKRAALVATLEQMQSYLRQRLDLAGAPKGADVPRRFGIMPSSPTRSGCATRSRSSTSSSWPGWASPAPRSTSAGSTCGGSPAATVYLCHRACTGTTGRTAGGDELPARIAGRLCRPKPRSLRRRLVTSGRQPAPRPLQRHTRDDRCAGEAPFSSRANPNRRQAPRRRRERAVASFASRCAPAASRGRLPRAPRSQWALRPRGRHHDVYPFIGRTRVARAVRVRGFGGRPANRAPANARGRVLRVGRRYAPTPAGW